MKMNLSRDFKFRAFSLVAKLAYIFYLSLCALIMSAKLIAGIFKEHNFLLIRSFYYLYYTVITFCMLMTCSSCKKESGILLNETFVKQFKEDGDFAMLGIAPLDDGNYLMAEYNYQANVATRSSPHAIKIDGNGKLIWDKPIPGSGKAIIKVLPVTHTGFLSLGY